MLFMVAAARYSRRLSFYHYGVGGVGGFGFDFGGASTWAAEFQAAMAPGLVAAKFGTMWVMVDFRAIIWVILSPNSAFLAMRLPTALSCWPNEASQASQAVVTSSIGRSPFVSVLALNSSVLRMIYPFLRSVKRSSE